MADKVLAKSDGKPISGLGVSVLFGLFVLCAKKQNNILLFRLHLLKLLANLLSESKLHTSKSRTACAVY